jgi:nitrite reductase (NADH) large subunit
MHANIQKDGTYSVVPRMWGGVTTPNELRAIADVVDKYGAPMVKVTGGQRLDLLRHQEGGPARRLGRSQRRRHGLGPRLCQGPAHGEDLRRLRMVPLRHAGFDRARHQDREDDLGLWMPHKFKIAVSGCPRNCAEATMQGLRRDLRRFRL